MLAEAGRQPTTTRNLGGAQNSHVVRVRLCMRRDSSSQLASCGGASTYPCAVASCGKAVPGKAVVKLVYGVWHDSQLAGTLVVRPWMGHGACLGHERSVAMAAVVPAVWAVKLAAHVPRVHAGALDDSFRALKSAVFECCKSAIINFSSRLRISYTNLAYFCRGIRAVSTTCADCVGATHQGQLDLLYINPLPR